jgi:hypothetical protein
MAQMIPERLPPDSTYGEKRVFGLLQRLPDECLVYYEPVIAERHPDFIVISPERGVLIIEVKGWRVSSFVEASDDRVKIRDGNEVKSFPNPVKQAREYMFGVMNQCRQHPECRELCHPKGPFEGNYVFPFGHAVFLHGITSSELAHSRLNEVFRGGDCRVLTKDKLEYWERLPENEILARIEGCFTVHWPFDRLTDRQIDILRAAIHPEIVVSSQPQPADTEKQGLEEETCGPQQAIRILDWKQESYARKIGHGHRVLNGVAGSGKTILLLHRARLLSKQRPESRILVLCYNRALSAYLKSEMKDCENVQASTFHQWGHALKAKSAKEFADFGLNVLEKVQDLPEREKYDAILIDEAQDLPGSCFRCAVEALKEGEDGDLIIVADGNQGIYRPKSFRWIDVGVKAQGRVIPLRQNYRNTYEIMDLAWSFAEEVEDDKGEAIVSVKPVRAVRNGPKPLLHRSESREKEGDEVVKLVNELLQGRWHSERLEAPLHPSEIGVIYPRIPKRKFMQAMFFRVKELLEKLCTVIWLNDWKDKKAKDRVTEPGLKIHTIDSSKGLQYRAVILMWADLLPSGLPDTDKNQDQRKLYVGLTRAQDFLAVTYSGDSEFVDQLEKHWTTNFNL